MRSSSSLARTKAGRVSSPLVSSPPLKRFQRNGVARQTPRVSISIRRIALAKRRLGGSELKRFANWNDARPETELNFKFYRQATNKIAGISDEAAAFLRGFFQRENRRVFYPLTPRRLITSWTIRSLRTGRQLHGDTAFRIEEQCDLLRTSLPRACDCVELLFAPDSAIR